MNEQPDHSKFSNLLTAGYNSAAITEEMVQLRLRGWSVEKVAQAFRISAPSVYARTQCDKRLIKAETAKIRPSGRQIVLMILRQPASLLSREQACQAHLIDLKRAGHSPTRTELDIPPDSGAVLVCSHERTDPANLLGDPAPGRSALDGYVHIGEGSGQQDAEVKRSQNRRYYARLAAAAK
jgi:hypothetical protein